MAGTIVNFLSLFFFSMLIVIPISIAIYKLYKIIKKAMKKGKRWLNEN